MSKKWIAAIAIYLGLLGACIVVLYAVPSVKGILEKTYIAEYGTLDVKDEISAYIVRDEHVYVAAENSQIERLAEEGELVKAASSVVELNTDADVDAATESAAYDEIIRELGDNVKTTKNGQTTESGYVCYYVDGAEDDLTTSRMGELTKAEYEALSERKSKEVPKRRCRKGEPVFKIVKNGKWYLIYYTDKENGARYREDSYVSMKIASEDIRVRVYKVEDLEDSTRVMLECKSFLDDYMDTRVMKTTVTLASAEGLVLQKSSVVENDKTVGVFVKNKIGEHVYKPISIIAEDGDKCVAYSDIYLDADGNFVETIGTYDEIIAEPDEEDIASLTKKEEKKE